MTIIFKVSFLLLPAGCSCRRMGQGSSIPNPEQTFGIVHSKLKSHLTILKCLANLSYPDFLRSVQELNSL